MFNIYIHIRYKNLNPQSCLALSLPSSSIQSAMYTIPAMIIIFPWTAQKFLYSSQVLTTVIIINIMTNCPLFVLFVPTVRITFPTTTTTVVFCSKFQVLCDAGDKAPYSRAPRTWHQLGGGGRLTIIHTACWRKVIVHYIHCVCGVCGVDKQTDLNYY